MANPPAKTPPRLSAAGRARKQQEAERRATLLRQNLLKRKAQKRARCGKGASREDGQP